MLVRREAEKGGRDVLIVGDRPRSRSVVLGMESGRENSGNARALLWLKATEEEFSPEDDHQRKNSAIPRTMIAETLKGIKSAGIETNVVWGTMVSKSIRRKLSDRAILMSSTAWILSLV